MVVEVEVEVEVAVVLQHVAAVTAVLSRGVLIVVVVASAVVLTLRTSNCLYTSHVRPCLASEAVTGRVLLQLWLRHHSLHKRKGSSAQHRDLSQKPRMEATTNSAPKS